MHLEVSVDLGAFHHPSRIDPRSASPELRNSFICPTDGGILMRFALQHLPNQLMHRLFVRRQIPAIDDFERGPVEGGR